MDSLKHRLRERCTDVAEWVDYRPDADLRWLAALPVIIAAGWAFGSVIGLGIALALALMVTVAVAALGLVGIAVWVVANTLVDLAYATRTKPQISAKPSRPVRL